jgi:hypothetical protein
MRIKNTMNYDQNDCTTVFFHNPTFFLTHATLKTKVGHVVGCIFEVECTVGGFLILKQIISSFFRTVSSQHVRLIAPTSAFSDRQLLLQIPFYPVVKKDLTFIHLGNDSQVEGLINFEKLRMIAKEVRSLSNMCSSPVRSFDDVGVGRSTRQQRHGGVEPADDGHVAALSSRPDHREPTEEVDGGAQSEEDVRRVADGEEGESVPEQLARGQRRSETARDVVGVRARLRQRVVGTREPAGEEARVAGAVHHQ